jgi:hypothetical protein
MVRTRSASSSTQSTAWHAQLQDIELMPQYQDFGFQPRSRLEEVAQHTVNKRPIAIIRRSCFDSSVTASHMDRVFRSDTPQPMTVKVDPTIDMKTPPKIQVDTMPAGRYFTYAAELLKVNPPHITDEPMIAQLKKIGIEPGKSFDFDKADPAIRNALVSAREDAQKLMEWKIPTLARVVNGWSMNTDTMGVYGNYYLKRAQQLCGRDGIRARDRDV